MQCNSALQILTSRIDQGIRSALSVWTIQNERTIWDNRVAWLFTPRLECILGDSGLAGAASTVARLLAVSQENRRTNCSLKCERSRFRSVAGLGSGGLFCASATGTEMGTGQSNCGLDDFSWGPRAPHRHLARARRNRQNQSQLPHDPSGRVPFNAVWALARFCSKKCCRVFALGDLAQET